MSHRRADLGHILLLNTNKKSYIGVPTAPIHVAVSDFEKVNIKVALSLKA